MSLLDHIKAAPLWLKIVVPIGVVLLIAGVGSSGDDEDSGSNGENASKPSEPSAPAFDCLDKAAPGICEIARKQLDQPLQALATDTGRGIAVSFFFQVDDDQTPQLVVAQSMAQMALVYEDASKLLEGEDIDFMGAGAYAPGAVPLEDFSLLDTSIGPANAESIAAGADPFDVWRVDQVDPLLQPYVD